MNFLEKSSQKQGFKGISEAIASPCLGLNHLVCIVRTYSTEKLSKYVAEEVHRLEAPIHKHCKRNSRIDVSTADAGD